MNQNAVDSEMVVNFLKVPESMPYHCVNLKRSQQPYIYIINVYNHYQIITTVALGSQNLIS